MNITKRIVSVVALTISILTSAGNALCEANFEHVLMSGGRPSNDTTFSATICHGEDYVDENFNIENPDPGLHIYSNVISPDSTVYLNLLVGETYNLEYYENICDGEEYHGHGFDIYKGGEGGYGLGMNIFTHNEMTALGCDSIVVLKLIVGMISITDFEETICYGENYYEHGFVFQKPDVGDYNDTVVRQTALGCDSITTLTLHVKPSYNYYYVDTVCSGESYNEHGFSIVEPAAGTILDSLMYVTSSGCDSVSRLTLHVLPSYDTLFNKTICFGENYTEHGFNIEHPAVGTMYDTLFSESIYGCDSIIILKLNVMPVYEESFSDTICFGEEYHEHGFHHYNPSVGLTIDSLMLESTYGCDSVIHLELYVAPVYNILIKDTICFGESYTEHGFNIGHPEPGMVIDSMFLETDFFGCDSLVVLNLLVGEVYDSLIRDVACYGDEYHKYGFNFDSLPVGITRDTLFLTSIVGCDSTVKLELHVAPTFETFLTDTICFGESYFEHGFEVYEPEIGFGTYQRKLTSTYGCDSLVELTLYVGEKFDLNIYDTICFGESYHEYNFHLIKPEPGTYIEKQELQTGAGCDSIMTLNLIVGQLYDILFTDTICHGESYDKYNFHYDNPEPGRYRDTVFLQSMHNCDSTVKLDLYVAPVYSFDIYDSICEGEDYDRYGLNIKQPEPGIYEYISPLNTYLGCDSIFNVTFKVNYTYVQPEVIVGESTVIVANNLWTGVYDYYIDSITGCKEYNWILLVNGDEENKDWLISYENNYCEITVTTPVETTLKVWAENPCGKVEQTKVLRPSYFDVNEISNIKAAVYPNPFNDFITVECDQIETIKLYNTLGQTVMLQTFNNENKITINLGGLDNSIYLLEVITSEGRFVKQISKY